MKSMSIDEMVSAIVEEDNCAAELGKVRSNLFATQFTDAFNYVGGPGKYWKDLEASYKVATKGKPIPNRYRSNKSVCLKAWANSASLAVYSKGGKLLGKTAIERKIADVKPNESYEEQVIRIIDSAYVQGGESRVREIVGAVNKHCDKLGVLL